MSTIYYAGIGSRATPPVVWQVMREAAFEFAQLGWVLRSGGADGADSAFEAGCVLARGQKEIFLPSYRFNGNPSPYYSITPEALTLAEAHHPKWERCTPGGKKLHARNGYQILGFDLHTPSTFVICWTKDGGGGGGTAQALRIAFSEGIPILDLGGIAQDVDSLRAAVDSFLTANNL